MSFSSLINQEMFVQVPQRSVILVKFVVCRSWIKDLQTAWLPLQKLHFLDILLVTVLKSQLFRCSLCHHLIVKLLLLCPFKLLFFSNGLNYT